MEEEPESGGHGDEGLLELLGDGRADDGFHIGARVLVEVGGELSCACAHHEQQQQSYNTSRPQTSYRHQLMEASSPATTTSAFFHCYSSSTTLAAEF